MSRTFRYAYELWIEARDIDESEWERIYTPEEIRAIMWMKESNY